MNTRRDFLTGSAALFAALGWEGCVSFPKSETLPPWKPGELDLHFIYTGCGENIFYRLPDGTAILNDTGDDCVPEYRAVIPLLPSAERLGGEWVARYLARVYPEKTIDYAIFSHFHTDHVGHSNFARRAPDLAPRFRTTADGRRINGFLCVAESFDIVRVYDNQYPDYGQYESADSSLGLLAPWIDAQRPRGLVVEPFRVGALDQIRMQRDPERYRGLFSVRNICANGKVWDGRDGFADCAAEHVAATGGKAISQNALSLGFVMQYGPFRYFAGGDVSGRFKRVDGSTFDYEALVGQRAGHVTLCKMNHHGYRDAMSQGFVEAVNADAYTACIWSPNQVDAKLLARMGVVAKGRRPLIVPNYVIRPEADHGAAKGYELPGAGAAHVVFKVRADGTYSVYLVEANDESMRVLARFDRSCVRPNVP